MHSSRGRLLWPGIGGAVTAGAVTALRRVARGGLSFKAVGEDWDRLLFGAALGGILTAAAALLVSRHYHQSLHTIADRIAACRHDAKAFTLSDQDNELQALLEPLQILCAG